MTTDKSPDTSETRLDSAESIAEVERLLTGIQAMDPAEAVEPMTRITTLLNAALDDAQEHL